MKQRNTKMIQVIFIFLALIIVFTNPVYAQSEVEQLRESVKLLKQQLEAVQEKLEEIGQNVMQNTEAVEVTAEEVEKYTSQPSMFDRLSIGGYGELHYNNLSADDSARDTDEIDFHRYVLFFNYDFSDKVKFYSEFELEHALAGDGEDKPGEVELEQAFIEYSFDQNNIGRVGVFLMPVGIMNETHEPPSFYGVERNTVENIIIPATWWGGGIGYTHRTDSGFSFDVAIHEGLEIDPSEGNARVRSGRQKSAEAVAKDFAGTARIKYTGMPGLELAASVQYQEDITQEKDDGLDSAVLYEFHGIYNRGPFGLKALYAMWDMDTDSNDAGDAIKDDDYDEQEGWYIEPSFKITENFGIFARYEDVEGGRSQDEFDQWVAGFNFWVTDNVVLKADYIDRKYDNRDDTGRDFDGYNLGFGYSF